VPPQLLYAYINKRTGLTCGLTSDFDVAGPRRCRADAAPVPPSLRGPKDLNAASEGANPLASPARASTRPKPRRKAALTAARSPLSHGVGYGEMSAGSLERVVYRLRHLHELPSEAGIKHTGARPDCR